MQNSRLKNKKAIDTSILFLLPQKPIESIF